jgi:hypothetical protein
MALLNLITEWILRLAHLRAQLAEDFSFRDGQNWLRRVQARILRFLVARYGDAAVPEDQGAGVKTGMAIGRRLHRDSGGASAAEASGSGVSADEHPAHQRAEAGPVAVVLVSEAEGG